MLMQPTQLPPGTTPVPPSESLLDEAVAFTFPASDPISIDHAFSAAREREQRHGE